MLFIVFAATSIVQNEPNTLKDLEVVFANVLGTLIPFGGILLLILLFSAGVKMITSTDSPDKVQAAKSTISNAILGIVLLASAYLILRIIAYFTGLDTNLTTFRIGF